MRLQIHRNSLLPAISEKEYSFGVVERSWMQPTSNIALNLTTLIILALFSKEAAAENFYWQTFFMPITDAAAPSQSCHLYMDYKNATASSSYRNYRLKSLARDDWQLFNTISPDWTCKYTYEMKSKNTWVTKESSIYAKIKGTECALGGKLSLESGLCEWGAQKGLATSYSCSTNSEFVGDPISTATGNSAQTEIDFSTNSNPPLYFSRTYNSVDGLWRHNHSTHLIPAGSSLILVMADGRESVFTINGSTISPSPIELGRLTQISTGWLYAAPNNDTYIFDTAGRLTRWANGKATQLLSYSNGVATVTDSFGNSLSFTEDSLHQPITFSTTGLTIQYGYNAKLRLSQLTRVRNGQAEQRLFHYEIAANPNLLTGITDERGVRVATWTFDSKGRATSSELAGGNEHTQVDYNTDGSSTVTNALGKKSIYRFVTIDGAKLVSAIEGEPSLNCPMSNSTFTYDSRGLLKTYTDSKGNISTYTYNSRGLEVSRTEASGTPQSRTITTSWHATFNLPLTINEPGRTTTYTYNAQGQLLSKISAAN